MVGLCVVSMVLIYGIRHSFSVFFSPILHEFGWSRGNIAAMLSLNILVYGLLPPSPAALATAGGPEGNALWSRDSGLATDGCGLSRESWTFISFESWCRWGVLQRLAHLRPSPHELVRQKEGVGLGPRPDGEDSVLFRLFIELAILRWGWRKHLLAPGRHLVFFFSP